jgi:lipopolysaccharide export system protein LptA
MRAEFATCLMLRSLVLLLVVAACSLLGQTPALQKGVVEHPQYPEFYDPPFQSQLKSLVQGAHAETLASNQVQITEAKVQNFRTNGEVEFLGEAPQCTYDGDTHSVRSPGMIRLQTGDGKLVIQGIGFRWIQTNAMLFISNAVHTELAAELWKKSSVQAGVQTSVPNVGDLRIDSEHFFFDRTNNLAVYEGNARVTGTNLSLGGRTITIETPAAGQPFQELKVDRNVVVDYEKMHVTGQNARWSGQTGVARVTGSPHWQFDQREGSGDELVLDRSRNLFRVNGHAFLKAPIQTTGGAEFFSADIAPAHKPAASTPATNRFLQVNCDYYEFQTNRAGFGDKVRAVELADARTRGTMSCQSLELAFAGTNELKSMVADREVVIEKEDSRLTGDRAVYDGPTGDLEVSGSPKWQSGPRSGRGDLIVINPRLQQMHVRTNAMMRLPAGELGQAAVLEDKSKPGAATSRALVAPPSTNQFADISATQYTLKSESARFEEHVRLVHPNMNWTCDKVNVDTLPGPGTNVSILAQGSVVFVFTTEKQPPVHGTCERAEYVVNRSVAPPIDRIEFTGNPVLETTNVTVRNSIIILDQTSKEFAVPGRYVIEGTASAFGTNTQRSIVR